MSQTVIPEFENVSTPWFDGQTLPWDDTTNTGDWIYYSTKADTVQKVGLTFAFPGGLWRTNAKGVRREESVNVAIQYRALPNGGWINALPMSGEYSPFDPNSWEFYDESQSALYYKTYIDFSETCQASADYYWAERPDVAADPRYNYTPWTAYDHWRSKGVNEHQNNWHSEFVPGGSWQSA